MTGGARRAGRQDQSGHFRLLGAEFRQPPVPPANLSPSVTRAKVDARAKADAYAIRWCNLLGVPFVMDSGRPLDIRQGATAVIIAPENSSAPRISTRIARHTSATTFSILYQWRFDRALGGGHPGGRHRRLPRTPWDHRHPWWRISHGEIAAGRAIPLLKDGALLSVTFTWTDPTVFRTPHSYENRYHRLPATYEPRQWLPCDPYDEERAKFLDPPQNAKPAGRAIAKE